MGASQVCPYVLLTRPGSAVWGLQQGGVVLSQHRCLAREGAATDGTQSLVVGVFVEDHGGPVGEALQLGGQVVTGVQSCGTHGVSRSPTSSNICPMDLWI